MKSIQMLLIACLSSPILISCGSVSISGSPEDKGDTANKGSATLTWDAPLKNIDGTDISSSEISKITKYRIYFGEDENDLTSVIEIDASIFPNSVTINYEDNQIPDNTTIFVAMTAINKEGNESNLSETISFN